MNTNVPTDETANIRMTIHKVMEGGGLGGGGKGVGGGGKGFEGEGKWLREGWGWLGAPAFKNWKAKTLIHHKVVKSLCIVTWEGWGSEEERTLRYSETDHVWAKKKWSLNGGGLVIEVEMYGIGL
jgi:hypothetical protein